MRRLIFLPLLAMIICPLSLAQMPEPQAQQQSKNQPRHDHMHSRKALLAGDILPLRTILDKVEQQYPGQVLEVELEHNQQQWRYEVKLLSNNGQLLKLLVDAQTGEVLGEKKRQPRAKKNNQRKERHARPNR